MEDTAKPLASSTETESPVPVPKPKYLFLDLKTLSTASNGTIIKEKNNRVQDEFRIKTYFVEDTQRVKEANEEAVDKNIKFAKLVEVNEYSPISVDLEVDWQSEDFEDRKSGEEDEAEAACDLHGNFLELKHIDKSTSSKTPVRGGEKSMLELIEECKRKNTTYETLMNTLKNSNPAQNLYFGQSIYNNRIMENQQQSSRGYASTGRKIVKTHSLNFEDRKDLLSLVKKSADMKPKEINNTYSSNMLRNRKKEYSKSTHESMNEKEMVSSSSSEEIKKMFNQPLKNKPAKKKNTKHYQSKVKPATYADIHKKKAALKNPAKSPQDKYRPIVVERIPTEDLNNATMDLSESEFSVKSVVARSDLSDTDYKLLQNLKKNNKPKDMATRNKYDTAKQARHISAVPQQNTSNLVTKLKNGSFSYFQFTKQQQQAKGKVKAKGITPSFINTIPLVESHSVIVRKEPQLQNKKCLFAKYLHPHTTRGFTKPKALSVIQTINIGQHKNKIERLISLGSLRRSVSPEPSSTGSQIELSQSFNCMFLIEGGRVDEDKRMSILNSLKSKGMDQRDAGGKSNSYNSKILLKRK